MSKNNLRALFVTAMLLAGLMLWRPWQTRPNADGSTLAAATPTEPHQASSPFRSEPARAVQVLRADSKRKVNKQERQRYRTAIREALSRRATPTSETTTESPPKTSKTRAAQAPGAAPLRDRSGGKLAGLVKDLQDDVLPLADECYAQSIERDPTLAGGLDLQFQIIGDQDVGGLVENVELLDSSEISNPQMLECMRETLLSTIFPAPEDSGSKGVKLTLQFSPDDAASGESPN